MEISIIAFCILGFCGVLMFIQLIKIGIANMEKIRKL